MKDEKLIRALKSGDEKALGRIVDKYSGYVMTVARNFSRGALSDEDIDEISVSVFYKLWSVRESVDITTGLTAYLSAAARNAVKNRFRAKPPADTDISELELASEFLVEEQAERSELMRALCDGVKQLSEAEREMFTRFYLYGESARQIAKATGRTESAVHTGLHRVREKLKKYLTERGFEYV